MKPFIILLLLIFTCRSGFAQEHFYAYKEDWSSTTDLKEATYFMNVVKEDTSYVCRYYSVTGPMIKLESYSDEALTIPLGRFAWYNEKGRLDSTGFILGNGRKDRTWLYFTHPDSSNATVIESYDNGKFLWREDVLNKRTVYKDGSVVSFDDREKKDAAKSFVSIQVEARFPNGIPGWRKYLEKTLEIPARYIQIVNGNGKATVTVAFNVDTDGSIRDVFLYKSVEWSVDTEAQRVIKKGPKWQPATQDGKKVIFRQIQSITFSVQE
jgi:periplasmic protein TonB